jgi:hypothetical protein
MNFDFLRVQAGQDSEFPPHPDVIRIIKETLDKEVSETGRWGARQFRFLLAGASFYIIWHVTEMTLRTPGVTEKAIIILDHLRG